MIKDKYQHVNNCVLMCDFNGVWINSGVVGVIHRCRVFKLEPHLCLGGIYWGFESFWDIGSVFFLAVVAVEKPKMFLLLLVGETVPVYYMVTISWGGVVTVQK